MTNMNHPRASATMTVTEPVVVTPGRTEAVYSYGFEDYATHTEQQNVPGQVVYSEGFESGSGGWLGVSETNAGTDMADYHSGENALNVWDGTGEARRDVSGLTVGTAYTMSAWVRSWPGTQSYNVSIGVVSLNSSSGATPETWEAESWLNLTYSFTATATTHTLYVRGYDGADLLWDDITLTGPATTQTVTVVDNNGLGGWSGTVTDDLAHTGTYSLAGPDNTRTFTGLTVGASYTLRWWEWNGTNAWVQKSSTFTATAASMARTLPGFLPKDDVELVRNWPATTTLTPTLKLADGDLTLDAGKYPYAQASISVPMPTPDLLEQIEPGKRVTLNASSTGAWSKTYTPWVDQRRNLVLTPQPTAYAGSGWAAAGGSLVAPGWIGATINSLTTAYIFTGGSSVAIAAGTKVTMTVTYYVTALGTGTTATHIRAVPHIRTGNVYIPLTLSELQEQNLLRPIVPGQKETVVIHWTADRAINANDLDIALTSAASQGSFANVTGGFAWRASLLLIEKGTTDGDFFNGYTHDDELLRTEWEGTANASTSTLETRKVSAVTWLPSAGITANLHLLKREASHDGQELQLRLASDEAILDNWAPLADDSTPRTHEANLRNLVNYVLGKAIPGAALQPGSPTADITATWDATNLQTNPAAQLDLSGWTASGGANSKVNTGISIPGTPISSTVRVTMNAGATGGPYFNGGDDAGVLGGTLNVSIREKQLYRVSAWVRTSASKSIRLSMQQRNSAGALAGPNVNGPAFTTTANTWHRLSFVFQAYPGTVRAGVYAYLASGTYAAGQTVDITGVTITEGTLEVPYFSGGTTDSRYTYAWNDAQYLSASTRTALVSRPPELFTWKAGDSAWKFLEPLTSAAGYRLFCDEQRRWWLINPEEWVVPGRVSARVDNTVEGTDTMDAEDDETGFTGVVANFRWKDVDGTERTASEAAGVDGKVKELEFDRPFSPGVAAAHLGKVQGQNRTQDVTCIVDYSVRPGMEVQIDLPSTNAQLGTLTSSRFELTNGLMSLQSAGLRDTPPGSIDLLTGTIDQLPGSIDSL